jgi:hypothetical protein
MALRLRQRVIDEFFLYQGAPPPPRYVLRSCLGPMPFHLPGRHRRAVSCAGDIPLSSLQAWRRSACHLAVPRGRELGGRPAAPYPWKRPNVRSDAHNFPGRPHLLFLPLGSPICTPTPLPLPVRAPRSTGMPPGPRPRSPECVADSQHQRASPPQSSPARGQGFSHGGGRATQRRRPSNGAAGGVISPLGCDSPAAVPLQAGLAKAADSCTLPLHGAPACHPAAHGLP